MILLYLDCMSEIRPKHGFDLENVINLSKMKYDTDEGSYYMILVYFNWMSEIGPKHGHG